MWFRNYQVVHPEGKEVKSRGLTLSETGPRMCLHPIKIFAGAFGGAVLFEDDTFVSPNARRAESKKADVGASAQGSKETGSQGAQDDARPQSGRHG